MQGPTTVSFEKLDASRLRLAIVSTLWNREVVNPLEEGALACIESAGQNRGDVTIVRCPGAFELPLSLKTLADSGGYDGLVAIGAVIRGDTPHFNFVATGATGGIMEVMLKSGIPIGFGLLTVDHLDQALARAGEGDQNKGWEAAASTIAMCSIIRSILV
jgi:6,7-dimethyl-8-ribityllumazine synthase